VGEGSSKRRVSQIEEDIDVKIEYLLNNEKGREFFEEAISYLLPLMSEVAERRLSLAFASIILSMTMGGEYAAERGAGNDPESSLQAALESLEAVCRKTRSLLLESWRSGELEKLYSKFIEELSESSDKGSEHKPARIDSTHEKSKDA